MKAVPGRKTDVADAHWIADLLRHGLLRASFIPLREQRDLRELTRHRSSLAAKRAHHRLILEQLLADIALFAGQIAELAAHIEELLKKDNDDIDWLDGTPGIGRRVAEVIIAEAGTDMSRFPSAHHFASWIALCPGQNESAGKRHSGKTRKGNRSLRTALVESAQGAVRKKGSYFGAQYRRIAACRGKKKALIAVAHSLAVANYNILKSKTDYRELGADFFDNPFFSKFHKPNGLWSG
ncbi:MAG: transposase [Verrucomicrobiota bacterium]